MTIQATQRRAVGAGVMGITAVVLACLRERWLPLLERRKREEEERLLQLMLRQRQADEGARHMAQAMPLPAAKKQMSIESAPFFDHAPCDGIRAMAEAMPATTRAYAVQDDLTARIAREEESARVGEEPRLLERRDACGSEEQGVDHCFDEQGEGKEQHAIAGACIVRCPARTSR